MKYSKDVKKVLAIVITICIILAGLFVFITTNIVDQEDYLKEDDAETALRTEKAKNNQTELLLELGDSYDLKGDFHKAVEAYKYALENDPKSVLSWNSLSQLYIKTGNFDEALFASEKVVELDSESLDSYFSYATILLLYDVEEAVLAMDKCYDLATKRGESVERHIEKINIAFNDFQAAYRKGNLYSAYKNLVNSEIYIDNHIEVELLTRLIESSNISQRELEDIKAIKANIEKVIAEGRYYEKS